MSERFQTPKSEPFSPIHQVDQTLNHTDQKMWYFPYFNFGKKGAQK